jgi:hypothetical protein
LGGILARGRESAQRGEYKEGRKVKANGCLLPPQWRGGTTRHLFQWAAKGPGSGITNRCTCIARRNYRRGKEDGASAEYDVQGAVLTQGELHRLPHRRASGCTMLGTYGGRRYRRGERRRLAHYRMTTGKELQRASSSWANHKASTGWYWPNGQMPARGRFNGGLAQGDFILVQRNWAPRN